jgi:predicted DNA-binding antitoxin AbrB/MazE fold protein
MFMTYRGHVENGIVKFDEPVALPEGANVQIELIENTESDTGEEKRLSLYDRLEPVIGMAQGLPPDASLNVDHYLYGQPKS